MAARVIDDVMRHIILCLQYKLCVFLKGAKLVKLFTNTHQFVYHGTIKNLIVQKEGELL